MTSPSEAAIKRQVAALEDAYRAWFRGRFGTIPNLTAWHFFNYMTKGDLAATTSLVRKYRQYCLTETKSATWQGAVRWWVEREDAL